MFDGDEIPLTHEFLSLARCAEIARQTASLEVSAPLGRKILVAFSRRNRIRSRLLDLIGELLARSLHRLKPPRHCCGPCRSSNETFTAGGRRVRQPSVFARRPTSGCRASGNTQTGLPRGSNNAFTNCGCSLNGTLNRSCLRLNGQRHRRQK